MIYADNAATTQLDTDAFEAMKPYLLGEYANPSQPYSFARPVKKALSDARTTIAQCIGADPGEIYFTSGGTESDNWAVKGSLIPGDKQAIVTTKIEHHAVLNACAAIEKFGYPVTYLSVDKGGLVAPEALKKHVADDTRLVSVMYVNNEIGVIEPIRGLAAVAHDHGALFHTDAVQAVGHIPIDVKQLDIDLLSASGHKFNAPKGIGFLYIKKGAQISPYLDGGGQESGRRAGTENIALIVAMAKALRKNCATIQETTAHLKEMEEIFLSVLTGEGVDYIRNGSDLCAPGIINISIKGVSGEMLMHRLDLKGICVSTGAACDSVNTQISPVLKAIGVPMEYAEGTIRVSFGRDNEIKDAEIVAGEIASVISNSTR